MYNFFGTYLHLVVGGFLSGVLFKSLLVGFLPPLFWLFLFLIGLIFIVWGSLDDVRRQINFPLAWVLIGLSLGLVLTGLAAQRIENSFQATDFGELVTWDGFIAEEPDERESETRLVFQPDDEDLRVLLVVSAFPTYEYGDRLLIKGKLEAVKEFETDSGRVFNYPAYLAVRRVGGIIYRPTISLSEEKAGSRFLNELFSLKKLFLSHLGESLPEPQASLLGGLVMGGKRSLGVVWQERFRRAGLVHLVVLSGYNLTIIGAAVSYFLSRVTRRRSLSLWLSILAIIIFSLMVGGGASVIRAMIMAIIAIVARISGRVYEASRALGVAIVVMVAVNPPLLVNDIGFQLSCLATLGLIYLSPLVEKWLEFIPKKFGLRGTIATTLAAQLAVWPWIMWFMGQVSIYGLFSNLLVVPMVPFAMLLSGLIGLLGFILSPLSILLAPVGYLVATYILEVTKFFANLPGANLSVNLFPFAGVVMIYVAYFFLIKRSFIKLPLK